MYDDNFGKLTHYKPPYRNRRMSCCNCCAHCTLRMQSLAQLAVQTQPMVAVAAIEVAPENAEATIEFVIETDAEVNADNDIASETNPNVNTCIAEEEQCNFDLPPIPVEIQQPSFADAVATFAPLEAEQSDKQKTIASDTTDFSQPDNCGLLHFRKWWERAAVELSVNTRLVRGVPVFIEKNTLRVINDDYSYFIPLNKVDYIRTTDGLSACRPQPDKHR